MSPEQALVTDERKMLSDVEWGAIETGSTLSESGTISGQLNHYAPQRSHPPYVLSLPIQIVDIPLWLAPVVNDFSELLSLPPDWDSYGAAKISKDSVENALQLLFNIMHHNTPRPHVIPTTGGNIQLEWHMFDIDIEIETGRNPTGQFNLFFEDLRAGQEWEEESSLNYSKLQECIDLLTSRVG